MIAIKVDISGALRQLKVAREDQIPFACARALTLTAKYAADAVKAKLPAQFRLRSAFTAQGIGFVMATKQNLTSWVNFERWYMLLQEYGGIRVGKRQYIAIPIDPRLRQSIPTNMRPKVLLAQSNLQTMLSTVKSKSRAYAMAASYNKGFILKANGQLYIATRMGRSIAKKRRLRGQHDPDLKILYILVPSARIPKRLHMQETVLQAVKDTFQRNFDVAMADAIRTAR
jgi:hypothetical protein